MNQKVGDRKSYECRPHLDTARQTTYNKVYKRPNVLLRKENEIQILHDLYNS